MLPLFNTQSKTTYSSFVLTLHIFYTQLTIPKVYHVNQIEHLSLSFWFLKIKVRKHPIHDILRWSCTENTHTLTSQLLSMARIRSICIYQLPDTMTTTTYYAAGQCSNTNVLQHIRNSMFLALFTTYSMHFTGISRVNSHPLLDLTFSLVSSRIYSLNHTPSTVLLTVLPSIT